MDHGKSLGHPFVPFLFGDLLDLQGISHVFRHSHMGPYRIGLEHHADVPLFRGYEHMGFRTAHQGVPQQDVPFRGPFKAGDHPQGSGFAASGGTQEGNEFPVRHLQVEIPHGRHGTEPFVEMFQFYLSHNSPPHQMAILPLDTLFRIRFPTMTITRMITDSTEAFWVSA